MTITVGDIFNWLVNTPLLIIVAWIVIPAAAIFALMFAYFVISTAWNVITESIHIDERPLKKRFGYKLGRFIGEKLRKKR